MLAETETLRYRFENISRKLEQAVGRRLDMPDLKYPDPIIHKKFNSGFQSQTLDEPAGHRVLRKDAQCKKHSAD